MKSATLSLLRYGMTNVELIWLIKFPENHEIWECRLDHLKVNIKFNWTKKNPDSHCVYWHIWMFHGHKANSRNIWFQRVAAKIEWRMAASVEFQPAMNTIPIAPPCRCIHRMHVRFVEKSHRQWIKHQTHKEPEALLSIAATNYHCDASVNR